MNASANRRADAEVVVRLRDEGVKLPLHYIPAGYGDMRMFRNVVDRLDADRPVYGLQPPGTGRVVYLRPRGSWTRLLNLTRIGKSWHKIARGGLEVHWMPGTHHRMLLGRRAAMVAAVLQGSLKRSDSGGLPPPAGRGASRKAIRHGKVVYCASVKDGRFDETFDWGAMERLFKKGLVPDPVRHGWPEGFPEAEENRSTTSL